MPSSMTHHDADDASAYRVPIAHAEYGLVDKWVIVRHARHVSPTSAHAYRVFRASIPSPSKSQQFFFDRQCPTATCQIAGHALPGHEWSFDAAAPTGLEMPLLAA